MAPRSRSARARRNLISILCAFAASLATPGVAQAFTTVSSPFTGQADLVTGFPFCPPQPPESRIGPIGALDDGSHLFIDSYCDGKLYRFGENGGDAATPDGSSNAGFNGGLALANGVYYGVNQADEFAVPRGVYRFDPTTLARGSLVATASANFLRDLRAHPASGDLYLSADNGIYRIQNPSAPSPTITPFATTDNIDGLAFKSDGSVLFAADLTDSHVKGFSVPGGMKVFDVGPIGGGIDGLAIAPANTTANGVDVSNNVFVVANDGTIKRIDVNNSNAVSTVASGGSRGDFAFVDSQGYLDVSQSDRYVRMKPSFFKPTTPTDSSPPKITITTPADGAHYRQGQKVDANYRCTDPDGPADVKKCKGPVANGKPIDTSTTGSHAFTVHAADKAGNTATKTVHYTVVKRRCDDDRLRTPTGTCDDDDDDDDDVSVAR